MKVAIVLNCGSPIKRKIAADKIICCDGGYLLCDGKCDILLGDFDSLSMPRDFDGIVVKHDSVKNASDGELAVRYAHDALHADELVFYGVSGGRLDHMLCNLAVMRLSEDLGMPATAEDNGLDMYVVRGRRHIPSEKGEIVSILPLGGEAVVTCSDNLFYPLKKLRLTPSDSRGLSNVSLGGDITVDCEEGTVVVLRYLK